MNKRKAIISIALCLTSLAVTAQQKLSITHEGLLFTDIMLYGADSKAHPARAMISTAVESCVIDSAFYHSTLKGNGKGKKRIGSIKLRFLPQCGPDQQAVHLRAVLRT